MPKPRTYTEFPLIIQNYDPAAGSYQVQLPPDKKWGVIPPAKVDLNYNEIETAISDLTANQIMIEDLVVLGRKLADRLLPAGPIRQAFCDLARAAQGVRLRLYLPDRPPLFQSIPWEYTYLPLGPGTESTNHFLALIPKVSVVRHPPIGGPMPRFGPVEGSIKMLVMMANPSAPGLPRLDLETEKTVLEKVLNDLDTDGLALEYQPVVEHAAYAQVERAMARKPAVFHFSGHGRYEAGDREGRLLLEEDGGGTGLSEIGAAELGKWLAAAGVRLAFLSACQTSTVQGGRSVWEGVAPALGAAGIPAVVAMQFRVQDAAAIAFSRGFYTALANGLSLDEAVSFGRLAMLSWAGRQEGGGTDSIQWGIPTLYLLAGNGVLFPRAGKRGGKTARSVRGLIDLSFDELIGGKSLKVWVGKKISKDFKIRAELVDGRVTLVDVDTLEGDLTARIGTVRGDANEETTLFNVDDA